MNAQTQANDLDINLLDLDLSSLADLEGFNLPPAGQYLFNLSLEKKKLNDKNYVSFNYAVVEALELADPDAVVKPNSKFNTLTEIDAEKLRFIKVKCGILASALGISPSLNALVENVQNLQVRATLKHRSGKAKSEGEAAPVYADVKDEGFEVC